MQLDKNTTNLVAIILLFLAIPLVVFFIMDVRSGDEYPPYGSKQDLMEYYEDMWSDELEGRLDERPVIHCADIGIKNKFECNISFGNLENYHVEVIYDSEQDAFLTK